MVPLPATVIVFAGAVAVAVYPIIPSFLTPFATTGILCSQSLILTKSCGLSPPASMRLHMLLSRTHFQLFGISNGISSAEISGSGFSFLILPALMRACFSARQGCRRTSSATRRWCRGRKRPARFERRCDAALRVEEGE